MKQLHRLRRALLAVALAVPALTSCKEDTLVGTYNFLDMAPKGRDEGALPWTMAWVRRHDEYEDKPKGASCCA